MSQVFEALQLDGSFFKQAFIVFIFFTLAKYLFFNKLKFVLSQREKLTSQLEADAKAEYNKAEEISAKYQNEINEAYAKSQSVVSGKKEDVLSKHAKIIKQSEDEGNERVEREKIAFEEELANQKSSLLSQTDSLAKDLVDKVIH